MVVCRLKKAEASLMKLETIAHEFPNRTHVANQGPNLSFAI